MGALIHLVGDQVTAGHVSRQRCLWCGALVEERDWSRIKFPIPAGMSAEVAFEQRRRQTWQGFVEVDAEHGIKLSVQEPSPGITPAGSCLELDPEVTR